MKTSILYFVIISFLFQSCYSYRAIDTKDTPLIVGKTYKIRHESKLVKSKLELVNDSTITVVKDDIHKEIPISEIKEIKQSKFSTLKTVGLVLGIGLVALGVVGAVAMSDFDIGGDFIMPQN